MYSLTNFCVYAYKPLSLSPSTIQYRYTEHEQNSKGLPWPPPSQSVIPLPPFRHPLSWLLSPWISLVNFWTSYHRITEYTLICLTFFHLTLDLWHLSTLLHSSAGFVILYCWVVFHCMDTPQLIYIYLLSVDIWIVSKLCFCQVQQLCPSLHTCVLWWHKHSFCRGSIQESCWVKGHTRI